MSMTDYLENQLLAAVLNKGTFTGPTTLYVALFTSDPTEAGTEGVEVSDPAYERQVVIFSSAVDGTVKNTNLIEFPSSENGYGIITHIGILDSATGGNILFYKQLDTAIVADAGVGVQIAIEGLTVSLD